MLFLPSLALLHIPPKTMFNAALTHHSTTPEFDYDDDGPRFCTHFFTIFSCRPSASVCGAALRAKNRFSWVFGKGKYFHSWWIAGIHFLERSLENVVFITFDFSFKWVLLNKKKLNSFVFHVSFFSFFEWNYTQNNSKHSGIIRRDLLLRHNPAEPQQPANRRPANYPVEAHVAHILHGLIRRRRSWIHWWCKSRGERPRRNRVKHFLRPRPCFFFFLSFSISSLDCA